MLSLAIIFWTVFSILKPTSGINLTYVVIKEESTNIRHSCIAEELERFSALGWIFPIPTSKNVLPNITTKYVPEIDNEFNCNFSSNNKCNKIWKIKNWQLDETSPKTFQLIMDYRWEEFPTIFTSENEVEFTNRDEIPSIFQVAFSVRTSADVEVLFCEGWNPYNYPCYHVLITELNIYLHKFQSLPKIISGSENYEDSYKTFAKILSDDEWRSFGVSLNENGTFQLLDYSFNRTVIEYTDKQPLKPLYLFIRSKEPALWKLHKNEFMYTKTAQISRMGPILKLSSSNLCVSLFVSLCENCAMTFLFMKNKEKIILNEVTPSSQQPGLTWQFIKLKHENILDDKVNIFVETKYIDDDGDSNNKSEGFWAFDDVRICHENEIKLTFLNVSDRKIGDNNETNISCQVVQHPRWRPKKLTLTADVEDFSNVEFQSNSTAINLVWPQEELNGAISYFITYKANDICESEPYNIRRSKSSGFKKTKHSDVTLDNLIPYTKYNVTLSSVLNSVEKSIFVTTQESESPTPEELPSKLQIQVTDSKAYVSWQKVDCVSNYGHLLYSLKLKNNFLNTTKDLKTQTENYVEIMDLEPYTSYNLYITTGRTFENIEEDKKSITMNVNFQTLPGLAGAVRNLEIYSTDKSSVSLRYDLPLRPRGIPTSLQVTRCKPILFKKCKSTVTIIKRCKLWPKKFCEDMVNLISMQRHSFKVSLINNMTFTFGDEVVVDAFTDERVPAPPTNITYRIIDCKEHLEYCHLIVSWQHPYNQNGTITSFNIILNATNGNETENIHEVFKVEDKSAYLPRYDYEIRYIPYSTHYELFLQSANTQFKSPFSQIHVKTADIGDYIDQKPKLLTKTGKSAIFQTSPVDHRLKSYTLSIMVQDYNREQEIGAEVIKNKKFADNLCHNFGNSWILQSIQVTNKTGNITIGNEDASNKYLQPNNSYCITFIVTNFYRNSEHDVVYYEKFKTPGATQEDAENTVSSFNYNNLFILALLLLLIPVGFCAYRWFKQRQSYKTRRNNQETKENVYESLPFEERDENCVNNETYDCLIHK